MSRKVLTVEQVDVKAMKKLIIKQMARNQGSW